MNSAAARPDRVALVTNVYDYAGPPAASALAAEGFQVICHSREFTEASARTAFEAENPNCLAAEEQNVEALVADAIRRYGRIDFAVSNDAAAVLTGPVETRSAEDYRTLLEAFTVSPFRLVAAVLPQMKVQGFGRILCVTSGAGLRPMPNMALYSAARAATNTMVKALAVELGPAGISINAVAPYMLLSNYFPGGMENPAFAQRVRELIPMQRPGYPEEIGALIALLASGKADFISGQIIGFSGGGA